MMPDPPPLTHGERDGADDALARDRQHTTDRADEADPGLFHDANADAYRNLSSDTDQREGTATEPEPEPSSRGGHGDDLPFLDHPGMNALAGAGAANAAGPGLTGPTVGADVGELATGEVEDERFR